MTVVQAQPFTAFEDELRSFESGVKASVLFSNPPTGTHPDGRPNDFAANGTLNPNAEASIVQLTGQAAWDTWVNSAHTAQDMRDLQYHSMNSLGYIGYQFGEPLMQDIGYYTADGTAAYDWQTAHFTGLDGATSLAAFETPIEEAAILREFGVNIHYVEYYLAHPDQSGITFSQAALPLDQYVGQTFTADNGVSVTISVTGILAAAHLTGWNGVIDLLVNHHVHVDQNGTPSTQYMNDYGGYDSSFFGATAQDQISNILGIWNNGVASNEMNVAETLYQEDFNGDGKIGDGTGQGIGGGEPGGLGGNGGGGGGNHTFVGDSTDQTFNGTVAGNDTVDYSQHATGGITVDLAITAPQTPGGGQGTDTLSSIENLIGTSFADHLYGNGDANTLTGNGDNDTLDGRGGADTMIGGAGNDVYYVDNLHDVVTEAVGGGTVDKVYASVTYTLDPNTEVEYLYAHYSGTTGITLTGNQYSHHVYGGAGSDILNGGTGNDIINGEGGVDTMVGGNGNDTYYVDNGSDVVTEGTGGGTVDKVLASVSYTLANNANTQVEYLYANSDSGITLTGNAYSHHIYGGAGNDTLIGGSGADEFFDRGGTDSMTGGAGNDLYFVTNSGDTVHEDVSSAGGADRVYASVNYTLTADSGIEKLYANDGSTGLVLGGNDLANAIYGGAGNDTISGGGGRDYLTGGAGDDVFKFNAVSDSTPVGGAYDVIKDFVQGHDHIDLTAIDAITGNANAHDAFNFVGSAAFAHAGDLRAVINTAGTATVIMGDTNGDGHVDFQVTLTGAIHLTTDDFVHI